MANGGVFSGNNNNTTNVPSQGAPTVETDVTDQGDGGYFEDDGTTSADSLPSTGDKTSVDLEAVSQGAGGFFDDGTGTEAGKYTADVTSFIYDENDKALEITLSSGKKFEVDVTDLDTEHLVGLTIISDQLVATMSNGATYTAPIPTGPIGPKGDDGDDGNQGIQGPKGDTGTTGGKGSAFTYSDFTAAQLLALKGPAGNQGGRGAKGDKGNQGDAFVYANFTTAQLASLKGATGDKGAGWTSGEYRYDTGRVHFISDDGLGFLTGDLRGARGEKGRDGSSGGSGLALENVVPSLGTTKYLVAELDGVEYFIGSKIESVPPPPVYDQFYVTASGQPSNSFVFQNQANFTVTGSASSGILTSITSINTDEETGTVSDNSATFTGSDYEAAGTYTVTVSATGKSNDPTPVIQSRTATRSWSRTVPAAYWGTGGTAPTSLPSISTAETSLASKSVSGSEGDNIFLTTTASSFSFSVGPYPVDPVQVGTFSANDEAGNSHTYKVFNMGEINDTGGATYTKT